MRAISALISEWPTGVRTAVPPFSVMISGTAREQMTLCRIVPVPPFTRPQAIDCLTRVAGAHRQNFRVEVDRGVIDEAPGTKILNEDIGDGRIVETELDRRGRHWRGAGGPDPAAMSEHSDAVPAEGVRAGRERRSIPRPRAAAYAAIARRIEMLPV